MSVTNFHSIELEEPLRLDQLAAPYHLEQLHGRRTPLRGPAKGESQGTEAGAWLIGLESEVVAVYARRLGPEATPLRVAVVSLMLGTLLEASGDGTADHVEELRSEEARLVSVGDVLVAQVEGAGDVLVCVVLRRPHAAG